MLRSELCFVQVTRQDMSENRTKPTNVKSLSNITKQVEISFHYNHLLLTATHMSASAAALATGFVLMSFIQRQICVVEALG